MPRLFPFSAETSGNRRCLTESRRPTHKAFVRSHWEVGDVHLGAIRPAVRAQAEPLQSRIVVSFIQASEESIEILKRSCGRR